MSLENLPVLLSALDTVLSLHFASSTSTPRVHEVCERATQLLKRRVDSSALELILALDPSVYKIVHFGVNTIDFGVCLPDGISPLSFGALLPGRRRALEHVVRSADGDSIKLRSLSEHAVSREKPSAGRKVIRPMEKLSRENKSGDPKAFSGSGSTSNELYDHSRKRLTSASNICKLELSNRVSKFSPKKDSSVKGLSLIERIKLKESTQNEQRKRTLEQNKRSSYVKGKAPGIYDVVYELGSQDLSCSRAFKSISVDKFVSIIKDSFAHSMVEEDIVETLLVIASALPNRVKIVQVGEVRALRIQKLDRNSDLEILRKL